VTVSSELTVRLHTPDGETSGSVQLPVEIFDVQPNMPLMHQVVVAQLAAARAGTHDTKTRGEVAGGGHKPYRQKGTGRARQGSTRAPQFVGGGAVHGPTPRNYAQRTPKKMKAAALRGALSDRARGGLLHVVSAIVEGDTPSTKSARKLIESISDSTRVLVVVGRDDLVAWQSLRNLPSVHLLGPDQLNTYDVLVCDDIVFTEDALRMFLARTGHEFEVDAAPVAEPEAGGESTADSAGGESTADSAGGEPIADSAGGEPIAEAEASGEPVAEAKPAEGKEDAK
jgi:large subunit ribosomal protein L4